MLEKWTAVVASAILAFAQAHPAVPSEPDFSGEWKLVSSTPAGADAASSMTVVQPVTRADVYGKPMKPFYSELLVTSEHAGGPRTERHAIGAVGGRVSVGSVGRPAGQSSRYRVSWEGTTLVMENSTYDGPEPETGAWEARREEWSFDSRRRLQLVITTRSSKSPSPASVTLLYQRR